jgi:hypothetical protein
MLKNLFQKQMTRKEFLIVSGLALLSITGVFNILKSLSNPDSFDPFPEDKQKKRFGSGKYGGVE